MVTFQVSPEVVGIALLPNFRYQLPFHLLQRVKRLKHCNGFEVGGVVSQKPIRFRQRSLSSCKRVCFKVQRSALHLLQMWFKCNGDRWVILYAIACGWISTDPPILTEDRY